MNNYEKTLFEVYLKQTTELYKDILKTESLYKQGVPTTQVRAMLKTIINKHELLEDSIYDALNFGAISDITYKELCNFMISNEEKINELAYFIGKIYPETYDYIYKDLF